jgi:hypothetical protein
MAFAASEKRAGFIELWVHRRCAVALRKSLSRKPVFAVLAKTQTAGTSLRQCRP